jgi:hypothetical protein
MLLAPLAIEAGGWGLCRDPASEQPAPVLPGTDDPDYQAMLALARAGQARLARAGRFDLAGFRPRADWVREMKRFGILPADLSEADPIDPYATEDRYWRSLWHAP